jgi:RNA polymerase sigma-70 factor (ECF subfamily)
VTLADPSDPAETTYAVVELSFDAFYRAEYRAVVRLCAALCGRRDVAEELAQDAFLAAHQRWASVRAYGHPEAWVRRVALNRALSTLRRRTTEARLLLRLGNERPRLVELSRAEDELWSAVRALPRRQAQVLALVFVEDRSVRAIADVLGCDEDTVRTHLRRGRLTLREQLGEEEHADEQ